MKGKIEKLLEVLQDLEYSKWQILKREVDNIYEKIQEKNVPNSELGTFEENLKHWHENLRKYKV